MLIDGLKDDGTLRNAKRISKGALADLESMGCAKLGDINVSEKWTYDDCTSYLSDILPRPFEFALNASQHSKTTRHSTAAATKPTWVLVTTTDHRTLQVVSKDRPTGKDLWFHTGGKKSRAEEVHIILGVLLLPCGFSLLRSRHTALRKAVPKDVIRSWKPVLAIEPSSDVHTLSDVEIVSDGQISATAGSGSEEEGTADGHRRYTELIRIV